MISDAHLSGNPSISGGTGSVGVTETFSAAFSSAEGNPFLTIGGASGGTITTSGSGNFTPPVQTTNATKDTIEVNGTGFAWLSVIDQTYSQTTTTGVPEPASIATLVAGVPVLGLLWARRRRAKV